VCGSSRARSAADERVELNRLRRETVQLERANEV
jgi:hypothetical protein